MLKQKKIITSIGLVLLSIGGLHAQESPTAAGGEATGTGGTSSYSVGQIVYTTNSGSNGSVSQGVQQPFEISTTTGINETTIHLEMSVFPNPTTDYLTLKVEDNTDLEYQLFNMEGKEIENNKITSISTTIYTDDLPMATYFLKVTQNNQPVKTFKIIKH